MERTRIALIPAYQPGDPMLGILQELYVEQDHVIVVDDGSGEGYRPVFKAAEYYGTVLTHPENRGKGEALKTGMRYIREQFKPPYTVVTVDADGQHRIGDICRCMEASEAHPDMLILGSRRLGSGTPLRSKLGNAITRWVYRLSTGSGVHDTQTGLRGFTDKTLDRLLEIPGSRYEYEMNVLMEFSKNKIPIHEVPIETVSSENAQAFSRGTNSLVN